MKKQEILGLILVMYDYIPHYEKKEIYYTYEGVKYFPLELTAKPNNYLKRKHYFNRDGQPTRKFYKLLAKYGIKINQLKKWQDEYDKTGHITQYDKLGNKHIL